MGRLHHYPGNFALSARKEDLWGAEADEAMHLNEIIEKLEPELSSSEIFAAMFELELAGKVKRCRKGLKAESR